MKKAWNRIRDSKLFVFMFQEGSESPPSPSENGRLGVYHRGQNRYHDST